MHSKSVAELSRDLESGKVSSVELTQEFLDRISGKIRSTTALLP